MSTNPSIPQHSLNSQYRDELPPETLRDGVYGSQPDRYFVVISNEVVGKPWPNQWDAQGEYRLCLQAITRGEIRDPYADTPLDDIPDDYWKNGDVAPLRIDAQPRRILWRVNGEERMLEMI